MRNWGTETIIDMVLRWRQAYEKLTEIMATRNEERLEMIDTIKT